MRLIVLSLAVAGMTACTVPDALLNVPLELESEEFAFDVSEIITEWEGEACADTSANECKVIMALDETDDGSVSSPPAIPASIPETVSVEQCVTGAGCATANINILDWAEEEGLLDDLKSNLSYATPIDVEAVASQAGVSVDGNNGVEIQSIALNWVSNNLNFDTVDIDFYVVDGLEAASGDPLAMIEDGTATMVGTLPAADAGATGEVDVTFASGGEDALAEALLSKYFTAVIAVSDADSVALPMDGSNILKPAGDASVQVTSIVEFEAGQF